MSGFSFELVSPFPLLSVGMFWQSGFRLGLLRFFPCKGIPFHKEFLFKFKSKMFIVSNLTIHFKKSNSQNQIYQIYPPKSPFPPPTAQNPPLSAPSPSTFSFPFLLFFLELCVLGNFFILSVFLNTGDKSIFWWEGVLLWMIVKWVKVWMINYNFAELVIILNIIFQIQLWILGPELEWKLTYHEIKPTFTLFIFYLTSSSLAKLSPFYFSHHSICTLSNSPYIPLFIHFYFFKKEKYSIIFFTNIPFKNLFFTLKLFPKTVFLSN